MSLPGAGRGGKRIFKDGHWYRMRRGKLVQIPDKWVGRVPHWETIRKRPSKKHGKRTRSSL